MIMNRTKQDEAFEKGVEEFFKDPVKALAVILGVAVFFLYKQKDKALDMLPSGFGVASVLPLIEYALYGIAAIIGLIGARAIWVTWYNYKTYEYMQIMPHADDEVDAAKLGDFMRRIHGSKRHPFWRFLYGKEYFNFTIHYRYNEKRDKNQYVFYVGAPRDRLTSVRHHMGSLYAKAEFYKQPEMEWPDPKSKGGRLTMRKRRGGSTLSLSRYKIDQLPGILDMMEPGTWVQVAFSPDSEYRLKRRIIEAEKEVKSGKGYRDRSAFDREEEKSFKTRFYGNEVSFHVTLAVASEQPNKKTSRAVNKRTATALQAVMHDVNELVYIRSFNPVAKFPLPHPLKMVWTGSELANVFHLPTVTGGGLAARVAKDIPHATKSTQQLDKNVLSDPSGYDFGELVHPLMDGRQVRLVLKSLGKQWGLTGITGSGKSTILNNIFKSFIEFFIANETAPGFSFIDPKKETATIALNQMLKMEKDGAEINWNKVHWISFKGATNPPAMNLLYKMPGVDDTVLLDQIMRVIRESGFGVAAQAERLLSKSIQALLADEGQGHTILGVKKMILDEYYRKRLLARLKKDPANLDIVQFWEEEAGMMLDQSGTAILNRIDQFSSNPFLRRIFGQADFNFPIREWMDDGHIVFYDFGGMGEQEIALIGGYLSYLYYRVADTRPDGSMLHQFVIDEAQRVKASILPEIHKEMRSKGLSLGISTQTMDSLEPELRSTLINVVANMFVCKQGKDGAALAAKVFTAPQDSGKDAILFSEGYLKTLPERVCVVKTEDHGQTVYAVVTVPPLDRYLPNGQKALYGGRTEAEKKKSANEIERSNQWTYAKAKELEGKNGLPIDEIDKRIHEYMDNGTYAPKKKKEQPDMEPEEMERTTKVVNINKKEELNLFD